MPLMIWLLILGIFSVVSFVLQQMFGQIQRFETFSRSALQLLFQLTGKIHFRPCLLQQKTGSPDKIDRGHISLDGVQFIALVDCCNRDVTLLRDTCNLRGPGRRSLARGAEAILESC